MSWDKIRHFTPSEFDSRDAPGSGIQSMSIKFVQMLDECRALAGIPFTINSGYRTQAWNKAVKGQPNSAHTRGLAADISAVTGREKFLILEAAIKVGFRRIGIYKTFIHLDNDKSLPQEVVWGP